MQRLMNFLAEQRAAALAELRRTVPMASGAFEDLDDGEWEALARQLLDAAELLVAAVTMQRRPPSTTVCVCRKCRVVVMPLNGMHDSWGHCGRLWFPAGALGFVKLPADFWEHHVPGDKVRGVIEAAFVEPETVDENATAAKERSKKGLKADPVKKRKTAKASVEAV